MLVVASAVAVSGCQTLKREPKAPAYQERPVEVLYGVAGSLLDRGAYKQSIDYFREVERQHPYSEWARRAIIMEAFAAYRAGDYAQAKSEADRYISLYPGNPSAPYAYYLKAICDYEQIVDVGRDQGVTEQAQSELREVVRRYPGSDYAADARLKLDRVNDHLAGKEMTVGRFYLRRGDTLAAIGRFRTVIDQYQTTSHTPEALYRLVEAYLTLGLDEEAQRNAAVLGANFPGSDWYSDAYALMTNRGYSPVVAPNNGPRRVRNLFGILPGRGASKDAGDGPLPVNQNETVPPPQQ